MRIKPVSRNVLAAAAILSFALPVLSDELDRLVGTFIHIPPEFEQLIKETMRAETFWDWVALLTGAVLFAAIFEELLFRGVLQKAFELKFDLAMALSFSALVFAMVHPSMWMLQVFLAGIVYGYLAWRSQSIIPGIILHLVNNFLALIYINVEVEKWSWYEWYGHVNPTVLALAACVTFYAIKWFNRSLPLPETDNSNKT